MPRLKSQTLRVSPGVDNPRAFSSSEKLLPTMPLVTPEANTLPDSRLPPSLGSTLSDGPPPSASPSPPLVIIVISRALATSGRYDDTPAPLNAEPTLMPSTLTRPSFDRPPNPPNTTMPGTTCTSVGAPAWLMLFGINWIRLLYDRDDGRALMTSLSSTICRRTLCTSTIGDSPVTVIVSSSPPTRKSMLIVAVNAPSRVTPSRLTVENPGNVNVTEYSPARRSTIRYWPLPSVVAVRTFSIRAGLEASTVTPGSTPPDESRTVPVTDACANATEGRARNTTPTRYAATDLPILLLRFSWRDRSGVIVTADKRARAAKYCLDRNARASGPRHEG